MRNLIRTLAPRTLLRVYRASRNGNRIVFSRFYDFRNSKELRKQIIHRFPDLRKQSNKGLVLDLGANIGDFSDACLDLGFSVIAVEPHPSALVYLEKRMKRKQNVEVLPVGVSNVDGKSILYTHPDHSNDPITTSISASTISDKFQGKQNCFEIEVISIDQLLDRDLVFQIVKVDIEGSEMLLVDSIIKNSSKIRRLLLETHGRFMSNTREANEYQTAINKLEEFIKSKNLQRDWLTDWI